MSPKRTWCLHSLGSYLLYVHLPVVQGFIPASASARCSSAVCILETSSPVNHPQDHSRSDIESSIDHSLEVLKSEWNIPGRTKLRSSLQHNPDLRQAILDVNLSEWTRAAGKPSRAQKALERHPLLMTRALLSRKLVTIQSIVKDRTGLSESEWQISKLARERGLSRLRVRQLLRFLESRLGFDQNHLRKVVLTMPQLFRYNGVEHFQGMVCYLESEVGTKNVKLMAQRWPVIFTYGLESSIKPTVAFLKTLGESRWERMLVKYPQLLTKSVETVLQPKIDYLEQLLNIRSARQLVTIYPPLLWLPIDVLEEKFQFLQSALELTREETEIIVETFPGILGLSVEKNLRPKIRFLREELSAEQLRDFVLYQPALLAYSLQNRLRPRIEKMQSADISFAFAPAYLMSMTDAKFGQWLMAQSSSWSLTNNGNTSARPKVRKVI